MIQVKADVEGVAVMVKALKSVDPDSVKELRAKLRKIATNIAPMVVGGINRQGAPLSGMIKPNKTAGAKRGEWGGAIAKVKTSFYEVRRPNNLRMYRTRL